MSPVGGLDPHATDIAAGIVKAIRHRIAGHRAALANARTLPDPEVLRTHITETEHRLAEAEAILESILLDGTGASVGEFV